MAHPHVDTMRQIDEAMGKGDLGAFFGYYTDDVQAHIRGKNKPAGDYTGKDQLQAVFGRFMEAMGAYTFENHAYLADDEHGIALQRSKSERGGETLELEEVLVMHFREGKVSEMWYVPVDQAALDAWIG